MTDISLGIAFIDDEYMPLAEARIPLLDQALHADPMFSEAIEY